MDTCHSTLAAPLRVDKHGVQMPLATLEPSLKEKGDGVQMGHTQDPGAAN